jgi:hypothetical protein
MPRRTAEEKAALFYRAGKKRPDPPRDLSTRAKHIWRSVAASKPIDWFGGGALGLLADHCETQARLEEVWRRLRRFPVGSKEGRELVLTELRPLRINYAMSARLLRLSVQAAVEVHEAKRDEVTKDPGDELVGGGAVKLRAVA